MDKYVLYNYDTGELVSTTVYPGLDEAEEAIDARMHDVVAVRIYLPDDPETPEFEIPTEEECG